MRLNAALIACSLLLPAAARAAPPAAVRDLRARADALRAAGEYDAALAAYQEERAAGGDTADVWKHIGWTERALRDYRAAAEALSKAVALDPGDREARDDLAALELSRGLRLTGWLGGTEPGTSKQALEGQLFYGALDRVEVLGGASWTDNIFYTAYKAFAEGSWFYSSDSYLRGAFTWRSYGYTGANRPTPDSNAYETVPRPELEISHWIARRVRLGLNYQLFAPNFQYDTSTRIVNHKLSGDVEVRLGAGFTASLMAAALRDPSPGRTRIKGRPLPAGMAPDLLGAAPDFVCVAANPPSVPADVYCAAQTRVVSRTELLLGGGLAYDAEAWGASVRYIPNRDLDAGFAWSVVTTLTLRPADRWTVELIWIDDEYSTYSGPTFTGRKGDTIWGKVGWQWTPALAVGAGLKWVDNPSPKSTTDPNWRDDGTLLLQLEYRTGVF